MSFITNALNEIAEFSVNNGVITIFVGAVIGFATSNIIRSFKNDIVDYYIIKLFKLPESNLVSFFTSIFEFIFILYAIYLLHKHLFHKLIIKANEAKKAQIQWEQKLLSTLENIDRKMVPQTL